MKSITLISTLVATLLLVGCTDSSTTTPKSSKAMFQSVSPQQAKLLQTGKEKESCPICGMHLQKFYKTNHAGKTKDGTKQYCSLHCVVDDNELKKTDIKDLKAIDANSLKFIPAHKATYVVGSSKPGTMSRTSKYAFAKKSEAEAFAKKFGGKVTNLDGAYTSAMKDFSRR